MADIPGTTRAQTIFLRAFRENPLGPPPAQWPKPATFRRWLRRPGFRRAMRELRDALAFQSDLHLSGAAASASHALQCSVTSLPSNPAGAASLHGQLDPLASLLRIAHLRDRFAKEEPPEPPAPLPRAFKTELDAIRAAIAMLRPVHPSNTVGWTLDWLQQVLLDKQPPGQKLDPSDEEFYRSISRKVLLDTCPK